MLQSVELRGMMIALVVVQSPLVSFVRLQTYERALFALLITASATLHCVAQGIPYRVLLRDKGPERFVPGTPAYDALLRQYAPRALERRQRMGLQPLVDSTDAPVYAGYLRDIESPSTRLVLTLPWFNSVVVECMPEDSLRIATLPCVISVTPVSRRAYQPLVETDCSPAAYGSETIQHDVLQTATLHDAGVYGTNVLIGVIDTGFRWKQMSTLRHLRVVREFDLIQSDSTTSNEPGDPESQDKHGSLVLSVLSGWEHDSLIGMAPFASVILAKTEDMRYEHRVEEEAYASAVMALERDGVDIITSSLGYRTFDDGQDSTRYADLNGSTTWAARSLNVAATRGVICVTSAGNDGPAARTIITPADADSAITIGALAPDGVSAWNKSSWGPTFDGRNKPDFAVPGVQIRCQEVDNSFSRPSGTSISAPIFTGGVALLRELYPTALPSEIRRALQQSAQRASNRDSVAGYGAPDARRAAAILGPGISQPVISTIDAKRAVFVSVFADVSIRAELIVRDPITGTTSTSVGLRIDNPWYVFTLTPEQLFRDTMQARIVVIREEDDASFSYPRDTSWFALPRNTLNIPCGVRLPGSVTSVDVASRAIGALLVADHPLSAGQRTISIVGAIPSGAAIRIVHATTGTQVDGVINDHGNGRATIALVDALTRGVYMLVVRTNTATFTLPIIVR